MNSQQLITLLEEAACDLGIAPSTLGERAGQGGRFYARLKEGKRVWTDTADKVAERVGELRAQHAAACDASQPAETAKGTTSRGRGK